MQTVEWNVIGKWREIGTQQADGTVALDKRGGFLCSRYVAHLPEGCSVKADGAALALHGWEGSEAFRVSGTAVLDAPMGPGATSEIARRETDEIPAAEDE